MNILHIVRLGVLVIILLEKLISLIAKATAKVESIEQTSKNFQ
jgi:hypothetical protein